MSTKYVRRTRSTRPKLLSSTRPWAAAAIGPLERGARIVGVTNGRFSFIDILAHVLRETGPAALQVASWVASEEHAAQLAELLHDGACTSLRLMIDSAPPSRSLDHVQIALGEGELVLARSHAKFATVRNARWDVAVTTSANLNRNARVEIFELDDNPEVATFFDGIFDRAARFSSRVRSDTTETLDQVVDEDLANGADDDEPDWAIDPVDDWLGDDW